MSSKLDVSDIADSIQKRISQIEEKLKDHKSLTDELERLQGALSALDDAMGRANAGRRGRRPVTQRKSPTVPTGASRAKRTSVRAPRGQNKAKILDSLKDGPKTASEITKDTKIDTGTVGATLGKMAKAGEVVKAARGYGLP
jgi:predicted Rossmann fold nucleotide-binding protein DprA/Smf involved in DNA uptake